ncbi:hypothetical protein NUW54_g10066 [Trametes sanguinea]|uniref:Uncharacterized protein n=1 Tax=Trametes sanguinea TaxID=158606 RepID=A0ACC1P489_9APHY|nr:hypothetical protein NUW54_g10066 [Trametes sanguinea]
MWSDLAISIPVSTQADEWTAAEVLRDEFTHIQTTDDAIDTTAELENATEATVELFARFLRFAAEKLDEDAQSEAARTSILLKSLKYFTTSYLSSQDIHVIAAAFDTEVRKTVLASYFTAVAALEAKQVSDIPRSPSSALLSAATRGDASIYALFGGQGTNEVYFDELQTLYDIYKPYVSQFLTNVTRDILVPLVEASEEESFYTHGLDVISWLSGSTPRPPVAYLASIPISFPLIGLTQLTQYLVVCRVSNITPGDLLSRLRGSTGHSQGLALKWLFYSGLRGQQAFPVLALEPSIVQDSVEGGEGAPSPMLSVTGLALKDLESHIAKTNKHLPTTPRSAFRSTTARRLRASDQEINDLLKQIYRPAHAYFAVEEIKDDGTETRKTFLHVDPVCISRRGLCSAAGRGLLSFMARRFVYCDSHSLANPAASSKLSPPAAKPTAAVQADQQKKPRHRHSATQLAALNELYEKNEHPSLEERTALAQRLGMYVLPSIHDRPPAPADPALFWGEAAHAWRIMQGDKDEAQSPAHAQVPHSVVLQTFSVGARARDRPSAHPGTLAMSWVLLVRFIIMPAIALLFVFVTAGRGLYVDDRLVWFLLILMPAGPSAMLLVNVAELVDINQGAIAGYLTIAVGAFRRARELLIDPVRPVVHDLTAHGGRMLRGPRSRRCRCEAGLWRVISLLASRVIPVFS